MYEMPTYTKEEEIYYDNLIFLASKELGLKDSFNFPHEKNDERSRMMWYFLSKDIENNPKIIEKYEEGINIWKKEQENEYWINNWNNIIKELKSGNFSILYEKNELMQQLRSKSPKSSHFLEDKLRKKIIDKISEINANSNFGELKNVNKQKI